MSDESTIRFEGLASYFSSVDFDSNKYAPFVRAVGEVLANEKVDFLKDFYRKDVTALGRYSKDSALSLWHKTKSVGGYFDSGWATLRGSGARALGEKIKSDSVETFHSARIWTLETTKSVAAVAPRIPRETVKFIDRINQEYSSLETDSDKLKYAVWLVLHGVVAVTAFNAGNSMPDRDFSHFGVGAHRSFLTHSALFPIVVTASGFLLVRFLDRVEEKLGNDPESLLFCRNLKSLIKVGMLGFGAGVTWHLLKDAFIDTGGTIRIHSIFGENVRNYGSIVPGTRVDDMAYTALMSYFSGLTTDYIHTETKKTS